jgi:hypothetical protein
LSESIEVMSAMELTVVDTVWAISGPVGLSSAARGRWATLLSVIGVGAKYSARCGIKGGRMKEKLPRRVVPSECSWTLLSASMPPTHFGENQ